MNQVHINQSVLLKNDMRKYISNGHFDNFISSISRSDVEGFVEVSDMTLKNGGSFFKPLENTSVIAIPLVGGVQVQSENRLSELGAEEVMFVSSHANVQFQNFGFEAVNLVLFSIRDRNSGNQVEICPIGISEHDELVTITANNFNSKTRVSFGVYKSRSEATYKTLSKTSEVLLFVVNGSFEIEGRLIEFRDSLVLWETEEIELEALADDSIICILERQK